MEEGFSSVREGSRTTNGWFLVLLEVIVDEAKDERGLVRRCQSAFCHSLRQSSRLQWSRLTLPTAASPSSTSLTLLLGFGAAAAESVMMDMLILVDGSVRRSQQLG